MSSNLFIFYQIITLVKEIITLSCATWNRWQVKVKLWDQRLGAVCGGGGGGGMGRGMVEGMTASGEDKLFSFDLRSETTSFNWKSLKDVQPPITWAVLWFVEKPELRRIYVFVFSLTTNYLLKNIYSDDVSWLHACWTQCGLYQLSIYYYYRMSRCLFVC